MRSLALLMLVLLAACVPQAQPQPPRAELESARLLRLDPFAGQADLEVQLRLQNPNRFELPLLESTLQAQLGNARFSAMLPELSLPAGGDRSTTLRLRVPVIEGTEALANLLQGRAVRLRLQGQTNVRLGPVTVPIGPYTLLDRDVSVNFRFETPRVSFGNLRIDVLGGRASLEYTVENPNIVGFSYGGGFAVNLFGAVVAQTNSSLNVPPQGRATGAINLNFGLPNRLGNPEARLLYDLRATVVGLNLGELRGSLP